MSKINDLPKCPICKGDIVGETVMPELGWISSYVCENGHWLRWDACDLRKRRIDYNENIV